MTVIECSPHGDPRSSRRQDIQVDLVLSFDSALRPTSSLVPGGRGPNAFVERKVDQWIGSMADIHDQKTASALPRARRNSDDGRIDTAASLMTDADGYIFWYNQRWYDLRAPRSMR